MIATLCGNHSDINWHMNDKFLKNSDFDARLFVEAARAFAVWLVDRPKSDGCAEALAVLSRLYAESVVFCSVEFEAEELPASAAVGESQYAEALARAGRFPFSYYQEVFNPHEVPSGETVVGDLCDDLADIYRDIQTGINGWDAGHRQAALFHWQPQFRAHWGEHLTSAIRALHMYATHVEER